ncbi:alkaline phosphatase family protein [Labrenzia sp. VG12]|uniref:alkaline phosphatase family protein n=1 Tax=Labrenzia sp. VG12 TaxID=2021862 RepID=UPI000B8BE88A|nr:alkaline phosphatase family protein [Labrenzia sp. VG12]ASP33663.1 nucleotide pyrophosphatase [Labrenzia sp. VG12]
MSGKVILVIMDGVGYDTAVSQCGYLQSAVSLGIARRWKMVTATPSISGPMYETIHTGLWPYEHGITCNHAMRSSEKDNVFSVARAAGRITAAVAHSYFHKLYAGEAWDPLRSIEHCNENGDLQYGRFYSMEGYGRANAVAPAEIDLCAQTIRLIEDHQPDYLLLHTCAADTLGHTFGGDSAEYRAQAMMIDGALARVLPVWRAAGYEVMITADHGMSAEGAHGGTSSVETEVPFYYFGDGDVSTEDGRLNQLQLAASLLARLGVDPARGMRPAFLTKAAGK